MKREELLVVLRRHPREAVALVTAAQMWALHPRKTMSTEAARALDAVEHAVRDGQLTEHELTVVSNAHGAASMVERDRRNRLEWSWEGLAATFFEGRITPEFILNAAAGYVVRTMSEGRRAHAEHAIHLAIQARTRVTAVKARADLAKRLPCKRSHWGPWQAGRVLARAGGYLWRETEGRFLERAELTPEESVDLDWLLDQRT